MLSIFNNYTMQLQFITFLILSLLASAAPAPSGISSALTGASRSGFSRLDSAAADTGSVGASAAARNLARNSAIDVHGEQQVNRAGSFLENHGQNLAPVQMPHGQLDTTSLARGSSSMDELTSLLPSAEKAPDKMSRLSKAGRMAVGGAIGGAVGGTAGAIIGEKVRQRRQSGGT